MRRAVAVAVMVAVSALTLSSCSHDEPAGPPTPSTSGPADPPPSSTTSPPATPPSDDAPTMPALAKKETTAGAKAFVRYYVKALNEAWRTGDPSQVLRNSTAKCLSCQGIAHSAKKTSDDGGFYHGGEWSITSISPVPMQAVGRPILHSGIEMHRGAWKKSASSSVQKLPESKSYIDIHLIWAGPGWQVDRMELA